MVIIMLDEDMIDYTAEEIIELYRVESIRDNE